MSLRIIEVLDVDKDTTSQSKMGIDGQQIGFYTKEKVNINSFFVWGTYHNPKLLVVNVTPRELDGFIYHYKIDCTIFDWDSNVFLPSYMLMKGTYLINTR